MEENETPLYWELALDELCGVYFIDHQQQRNVFDDPRGNEVQLQVDELRKQLAKLQEKQQKVGLFFLFFFTSEKA